MTKDEVERIRSEAMTLDHLGGTWVGIEDYAALLARAEAAEVRLSSTGAQRMKDTFDTLKEDEPDLLECTLFGRSDEDMDEDELRWALRWAAREARKGWER